MCKNLINLHLFTQLFHRHLDVKKLQPLDLKKKKPVQCVTVPPSYSAATFTFIPHDTEPPLCLPSSSELHCPAINRSYSWRPVRSCYCKSAAQFPFSADSCSSPNLVDCTLNSLKQLILHEIPFFL
jgi:hypothetical protein